MSRRWWRTVAVAYLASFCFFAYTPVFRATNPRRAPLDFTDHMAHWGSAILMAFHGFDVYRERVERLCEPAPESNPGVGPAVTCRMPDRPEIRTFAENWQHYPRVYPPGAMLFGAPSAALYALTSASFSTANLVFILECILAAHAASLLMLLGLWRQPDPAGDTGLVTARQWNGALVVLFLPIIHLTLVCWASVGIYDASSVLCIIAGVLLLGRGRAAEAVLALSAGMFLHFRGLWYLPLLGLALWRTLKVPLTRRSAALLGGAALLLVPTAVAFYLVWPALKAFPVNNPIFLHNLLRAPEQILVEMFPFALGLGFLLWNRSWLTAGLFGWQLFMLVQTHEVRTWHMLFAWPLLVLAAQEMRGALLAVVAMFILVLAEAHSVFGTWPLSGQFLTMFLVRGPYWGK